MGPFLTGKLGDFYIGANKEAFERRLKRDERVLRSEHREKLAQANQSRIDAHKKALADKREAYLENSAAMKERHEAEHADIKNAWNKRVAERQAFINKKVDAEPLRKDMLGQHRKAALNQALMDRMNALDKAGKLRADFYQEREAAREQDNDKDQER